MTQALVVVGVFVFFITVFGAIMVGGHLLEEPQRDERTPVVPPVAARPAGTVAPTNTST